MAGKSEKELTCQSCQHDGCHVGYSGWPDKKAIKYFRTPEEKRQGFDLTYQFARQSLGCPIQDDLFVAAVQRSVDQHQKGTH